MKTKEKLKDLIDDVYSVQYTLTQLHQSFMARRTEVDLLASEITKRDDVIIRLTKLCAAYEKQIDDLKQRFESA